MIPKRVALLSITLPVVLVGGLMAFNAHQSVTPIPLCNSTLGGMAAYSPSDPTGYGPLPSGVHGYTRAEVDALSSYVARYWHQPLAVVDRATGAWGLYGPRYDTTAFVFDTGVAAATACISDVADRTQDAANFVPPHAPFLVVAVNVASTATETGTIPGPTTVTVDGDPVSVNDNGRADLETLARHLFAAR